MRERTHRPGRAWPPALPRPLPRALLAALVIGFGGPAVYAPEALPDPSAPAALEARLDAVIEALHEGDYSLAGERIARAEGLDPDDAGVRLVRAYALAWQGAHHIRALSEDASFLALLDSVRERAERSPSGAREEGRLAYYAGLASLMRARTQFGEGRHDLFRAASDTRRGVRALERAVALGYDAPDASFWLGAYHAMAGALPAPLRALKALIGLPGGSLDEGLGELRLAARHGRRFRLEARLFLAGVLAEEVDGGYAQAVDVLRQTLPEITAEGSVLPLFAGELLAEWGLTPQAVSIWEGVLQRRVRDPRLYSTAEVGRLHHDIARALWQEQRWAEAVPHLRAILDPRAHSAPALAERAALLLARCHARLGEREAIAQILADHSGSERTRRRIASLLEAELPDPRVERDLAETLRLWRERGVQAARPRLEDFVRRHPRHAAGLLHAGRAAFEASRREEAAAHFRAVLALEEEEREVFGWARLFLGWIADLEGRRGEALDHYRRAERLRGFDAWRAGVLFAQVPYPLLPSRDPDVWALLRDGTPSAPPPAASDP